jgi:hypothetical protein
MTGETPVKAVESRKASVESSRLSAAPWALDPRLTGETPVLLWPLPCALCTLRFALSLPRRSFRAKAGPRITRTTRKEKSSVESPKSSVESGGARPCPPK